MTCESSSELGKRLRVAIERHERPAPDHIKAKAVILSPKLLEYLGRRASYGADIRGMHGELSQRETTFDRAEFLRRSIEECEKAARRLDGVITEMLTGIYTEER